MGYENIFTMILFLIGLVIVSAAQSKIQTNYRKYKQILSKKKMSGVEVARQILDANGLSHVHVVETKGELTDHYDPSRKVVRLSREIFQGESIASVSVAAHECGHAIQDKEGYFFMKIRSTLVPIVNFITYIGYGVSILSLFLGVIGYLKVGIFMILTSLIFQLVTLPVEFDASKRALTQLEKLHILDEKEKNGAYDMLKAAALTYIASFVSSILNLLRLLIMLGNRRDD